MALKARLLDDYFDHTPSCIMVIIEEAGTLRDMHEGTTNPIKLDPHELTVMNLRSRFNADLCYYIVDCDSYQDLGLTHEYVFDMIVAEYNKSGNRGQLDQLFPNIKRI